MNRISFQRHIDFHSLLPTVTYGKVRTRSFMVSFVAVDISVYFWKVTITSVIDITKV